MNWEAIGTMLAAAVIGGMVSGGGIAALGYRGLKDKLIGDLKEIFAKRSDLNGLRADMDPRIERMTTVAMNANDLSAQNTEAIARMQEADRVGGGALNETLQAIRQELRDIDGRQRTAQSQIDKTATLLDEVSRRLNAAHP